MKQKANLSFDTGILQTTKPFFFFLLLPNLFKHLDTVTGLHILALCYSLNEWL